MRNWKRVNRKMPCPVCHKADWCLVAPAGDAVICARISVGGKRVGSNGAGWLHRIAPGVATLPQDQRWRPDPVPDRPKRDWDDFCRVCEQSLPDQDDLAELLGVEPWALGRLNYGWSIEHGAWVFPMRDGTGQIVGAHRRYRTGAKRTVAGSRLGLFIPDGIDATRSIVVCEGPSDCAALVSHGFDALGRPSNTAGHDDLLVWFARHWACRDVVILRDHDPAGSAAESATRQGAARLAESLVGIRRRVKTIRPPNRKDAREWLAAAGADAIRAVISDAEYVR